MPLEKVLQNIAKNLSYILILKFYSNHWQPVAYEMQNFFLYLSTYIPVNTFICYLYPDIKSQCKNTDIQHKYTTNTQSILACNIQVKWFDSRYIVHCL